MIELIKHIEILLLENDCVIVPGLGGFIAHNRPAVVCNETNEFYPPLRTIGFNPQLIMNDGLLVQSYMQAYNTDFPDATRKIEKIVDQLKEEIYQQGQVELGHIGTLYYNVRGVYEFEPRKDTFFTPSLYGLDKIILPRLVQHEAVRDKARHIEIQPKQDAPMLWKQQQWKHVFSSDWIQYAASVAAAILLFFILSTPVENTYVDEANYASLGSTSMFDAIRGESIVTTLASYVQPNQTDMIQDSLKRAKKQSRPKNNVNTLKPITVKTEKIAAAEPQSKKQTATHQLPEATPKAVDQPATQKNEVKDEVPAMKAKEKKVETVSPATNTSTPKSYVIVASFPAIEGAQKQAEIYRKAGYKDAQVITSNGRYRVAISQFSNSSEAYKQINQFKANNQFKDAWVFTTK